MSGRVCWAQLLSTIAQGCHVDVQMPAQNPPETSPDVAQLAVSSVDYYRMVEMQLVHNRFKVNERVEDVQASTYAQNARHAEFSPTNSVSN